VLDGRQPTTPLYGGPFKCKEGGSPKVTLLAIESQGELTAIPSGKKN
jgi:hypothetical protein